MHRSFLTLGLLLLAGFSSYAQYTFNKVDIRPGPGHSGPRYLASCNNILFFSASDSVHGWEPWISDGSVSGTKLLLDIVAGTSSSDPYDFTAYNGKTYFQAWDATHGTELWVSDGTTAGTKILADIQPGSASSSPNSFVVAGGLMYFSATDPVTGMELYVTDGTASGTHLVKDIWTGKKHGYNITKNYSVAYNGKLYFNGTDGTNGSELWTSDGTTAGTYMVKDIIPGSDGGMFGSPFVYNSKIYFSGKDGTSGYELFVSDGTASGTQLFMDLAPNPGVSSQPNTFTEVNGKMFFAASENWTGPPTEHYEPWVSDGTVSGTHIVKDIWPGPKGSMGPITYTPWFTAVNNKVFFTATDSTHGGELWASDGTSAGTYMVKDVIPAPGSGGAISEAIAMRNKLFYAGYRDTLSGTYVQEIMWVSDGTATGTRMIEPFHHSIDGPLATSLRPRFVVLNNKLFFPAWYDSASGQELWWIEDTGKITPPTNVAKLNTEAAFSIAPNPSHGNVVCTLNKAYTNAAITVTDITGRKVYQQIVTEKDKQVTLNLSNIPKGSYIVNLKHAGGSDSRKLLLE